jgi:hypothetical protein
MGSSRTAKNMHVPIVHSLDPALFLVVARKVYIDRGSTAYRVLLRVNE